MTNVVVNPSYLNIAYIPQKLKDEIVKKLENIPASVMWPIDVRKADPDKFDYQTGIDDIIKGLKRPVEKEVQEKNWKYFLQYTKDLDKLRGTDTFSEIPELIEYKEQ